MADPTRWSGLDRPTADRYAARFEQLEASGVDVHGEAAFIAGLLSPGDRVLDAGCGTGRVALRLAQLGFRCLGVDADEGMLAVAARDSPPRTSEASPRDSIDGRPPLWVLGDLASPTGWSADARTREWVPGGTDLVVAAGNVIPLLGAGTLLAALVNLTAALRPRGLLVSGFGLDPAHLPSGCPATPLEEYDAAAEAAGLELTDRFATWSGTDFGGGGYAVSVHRRRPV